MARAGSAIQREIRQRKPFESLEQEAIVAMLRTADRLRHFLAGIVEPRGTTLQQYNVLRILRGARGDGLPTLEIAGRMVERAPGITRLMDRLEAKGLVRRVRCPKDRRQVLCFVTEKGLALLSELEEPMARADDAALEMLEGRHLRTLIKLLDRIRAGHT